MSEFCMDCFNKYGDEKLTEKDVILSRKPDFCEGCCQYKKIVISIVENNYFGGLFLGFNNKKSK